MKEKKLQNTLTIRISKSLYDSYKEFCDDNGLSLSKRIRFLLEKDIDGKVDIKK